MAVSYKNILKDETPFSLYTPTFDIDSRVHNKEKT